MGICSVDRHDVVSDWSEEQILQLLAKRDLNKRDANGFTPLAVASYEAHCATNSETRNHWLQLTKKLLEAGADVLTPLPELFAKEQEAHRSNEWNYTSHIHNNSHIIADQYSTPFICPKHKKEPSLTAKNSWIICSLLEHENEALSKDVLSELSDAHYSELLLAVMTATRQNDSYLRETARDPRFDKTLDQFSPELLASCLTELAEMGDGKLAQRFLRPQVPLDHFSGATVSALHWACHNEDGEFIDALLKAGAKPNLSASGITPFVMAAGATSDPRFLRDLVNKGFRIAPEESNYSDAEKRDLVMHGYDSPYRGNNDSTPGHAQGKAGLLRNQSVFDTLHEMHNKLILPAMLHEFEKTKTGKKALGAQKYFRREQFNGYRGYEVLLDSLWRSRNTSLDANHYISAENSVIDFMQLHHTQNHPNISYPTSKFEQTFNFEWHALTAKSYKPLKAAGGWTVECLTNSSELREESRVLGHCVGKSGYDHKCAFSEDTEQPHIFSIRKNGVPVSTFEVKIYSRDGYTSNKSNGVVGDNRVVVVQHRGRNDKRPPQEARQLLDAWLDDVSKGLVPLNAERGILPDNKKLYEMALSNYLADKSYTKTFYESAVQVGSLISTLPDAKVAFEDAMRDTRRASERVGRDTRLIYTDSEQGDKRGKYHLISGYHDAGGKDGTPPVSYRDMSYNEWLRASGITHDVIRPMISQHYPEVAHRMEKMWQREDAVPITGEMSGRRDRTGWQQYLNERSEELGKRENTQWSRRTGFSPSPVNLRS